MGNNHFPPPTGETHIDITQNAVSLYHCQGTQLAHVQTPIKLPPEQLTPNEVTLEALQFLS